MTNRVSSGRGVETSPGTHPHPNPPPSRGRGQGGAARWYALLAAGVAAFTVYGSLVPFTFHHRDGNEVAAAFSWAMRHRTGIESRSDGVANFLLGVPLGFGVLAALRVDRRGAWRTAGVGAAVWPACVGLAGFVEFLQLYLPTRTCSGADVIAQAAGSACGMLAWLLVGQRFTDAARRAWSDPRVGGRASQFLAAYLLLILLVQTLPLDLTASPFAVYRKVRDGGVCLTPFGELGRGGDPAGKVKSWVILFGAYLPAGLLLARRNLGTVALAAGVIAIGMEASQLFVSRSPSVTDAVVGTAAVLAGWGIANLRRSTDTALSLGLTWFAALAFAAWFPFAVRSPAWDAVAWVPFADLFLRNDLDIPGEALSRMLAFAPFGILLAARGRPRFAPGIAGGLAAVLEAGQLFVAGRTPGTTDVVLAALGAGVAAAVTRRMRHAEPEPPVVVWREDRRAA